MEHVELPALQRGCGFVRRNDFLPADVVHGHGAGLVQRGDERRQEALRHGVVGLQRGDGIERVFGQRGRRNHRCAEDGGTNSGCNL